MSASIYATLGELHSLQDNLAVVWQRYERIQGRVEDGLGGKLSRSAIAGINRRLAVLEALESSLLHDLRARGYWGRQQFGLAVA
jgi:hypothetical protein